MKAKAIIEVVLVFAITMACIALVGLSPIGRWERQVLHRVFMEYVVMIALPLLWMLVTRRNFAAYGISFANFRYHLDIAVSAFIPVALASIPLAFLDYTQWSGALILAAVQIALLFILGWILKRKPTRNESRLILGALVLINLSYLGRNVSLLDRLGGFIFYLCFLAVGEEVLFRGFIQSRLNAVFGKPFQFFGVKWGWGVILTAVIFASMHLINIASLIDGHWVLSPWWALWTFFAGLVYGFVREKTGSILASTILHGLPQGLAAAFLGV